LVTSSRVTSVVKRRVGVVGLNFFMAIGYSYMSAYSGIFSPAFNRTYAFFQSER
jgi:hypothetical protein